MRADEGLTPEERERRRRTPLTAVGLALAAAGASEAEVLAADEEACALWDAEEAAEREARATARRQAEERRELDLAERRLRLAALGRGKCRRCGAPIQQPRTGRSRVYCSAACREAAARSEGRRGRG